MNLENKVCSLEYAKKLKELGIEQKSFFCYQDIKDSKPSVLPRKFNLDEFEYSSEDERLAAFTSSELIGLLPHRITLKKGEPFNSFTLYIKKSFIVADDDINKITYIYIINYECDTTELGGENAFLRRILFEHNICNEKFSDALAKTLIYLLENEFIKIQNEKCKVCSHEILTPNYCDYCAMEIEE